MGTTTEILNAKIDEAFLGYEDHGILAINLVFDFDSFHQGTGSYQLTDPELIKDILDTVGVNDWSKLKGKYVRVKFYRGLVTEVGNIFQDKWTTFREV